MSYSESGEVWINKKKGLIAHIVKSGFGMWGIWMSDLEDAKKWRKWKESTQHKVIEEHITSKNREIVKHIRDYRESMRTEPEQWMKMSEVYHAIGRILGDE